MTTMKVYIAAIVLSLAVTPSCYAFTQKAKVEVARHTSLPVFQPLTQIETPKHYNDKTNDEAQQTAGPEEGKVLRQASSRKKWGIDNAHAQEYWFDNRIHTLGNIGIGGALHAALAPVSTKLIDIFAYEGVDIRAKVARTLSQAVGNGRARVLDLCCGVGISTRALHDAFPDAVEVIGLDTSPQMIAMANFLAYHLNFVRPVLSSLHERSLMAVAAVQEQQQKINNNVAARVAGVCKGTRFVRGNSEGTDLPSRVFDLVTIMYAFHEVPKEGRDRILEEARRVLKPGGTLAVVDISTDYIPSVSMLAGEPYVIEYQKNIHKQIEKIKGFLHPRYETLVPGHVGMWLLQRTY